MDGRQHIAIFTTASLPWLTGTAVNPLFRAAYLAKDGERKVTLVIPWLSLKDQILLYPNKSTFISPSEQETYVRCWLEERTGFKSIFKICFYPGKKVVSLNNVCIHLLKNAIQMKVEITALYSIAFAKEKGSILPVGDITEVIPNEEADVAVLEEPEHLTWFHHGQTWKRKFRHVIGVVIRLSAATQDLPQSIVCNVHGVNPKFIEIGKRKQEQQQKGNEAFTKGAYYIGKMVWSKGYRDLLQLLLDHQDQLSDLQVDLYGNGEDSDQVCEASRKLKMAVDVNPGRDHADPIFHEFIPEIRYKVFLNPSTTDVVCTTTAEALAMGKIVLCADHPCNEFFKQFPNCRMFKCGDEFARAICTALADEPALLTDQQRHELSWEAATERFLEAAELKGAITNSRPMLPSTTAQSASISLTVQDLRRKMEDASALVHYTVSGIEVARRAFGAIPGSLYPDEEQCEELGLHYMCGSSH
ncbi:hypothetical protein ACLOJK_000267 [Asimina triloba]